MNSRILSLTACCLAITGLLAADVEPGFTPLFDGRTLDGWKAATENESSFQVTDGAIVANGERCHLFYVGAEQPFKNFELRIDVMTEPGSNGGIYFHTGYQETGWPTEGFESQVNVTQGDWIKTGSLYGIANVGTTPARDNEWWTQSITVSGNQVTVKINDVIVLQYVEPNGAQAGNDFERKIGEGTFALQAHDPGSKVYYKNIRVKRLAD